jgi:hypothetical protein
VRIGTDDLIKTVVGRQPGLIGKFVAEPQGIKIVFKRLCPPTAKSLLERLVHIVITQSDQPANDCR